MEPFRDTFWAIPHWAELTVYVLGGLTSLILLVGIVRRVARWRRGRPEPDSTPWATRVTALVRDGLFQGRLADDRFALATHLMIFSGMVVLACGTAVATVDWDVAHLFFDFQFLRGTPYLLFELVLDVFGVVLIAGLGMALWRRYVTRPDRLKTEPSAGTALDSLYLLTILMVIAVSGFAAEALRIAAGEHTGTGWAPFGYAASVLFVGMSSEAIQGAYLAIWWAHAVAAFVFLVSIPFTKAFHLISSPLNIALRSRSPVGRLRVADESGAGRIGDFTWRQLLQMDSCTACGRCEESCPGHTSGMPLSPKSAVCTLGRELAAARPNGEFGRPLHGDVIGPEALWACCTCRACEAKCPVAIEQPRLLIDMRRRLVYDGQVDEGLQDALMNLTRYGNSFGQSARKRAAWAKGLDVTVPDARKEPVEYLWFVGDYASYDPRANDVTVKTAQVLQDAGVSFGLLFDKEQNAGNDVRRVGEEGLFDQLREKNLTMLGKAQYQRVLTNDPHTYNTLKNEYADGNAEEGLAPDKVVHCCELFDSLIREQRLQVREPLGIVASYHDPCYLGRYNGVYEPPRRVLEALGVRVVELPRSRRDSFCCGAGGGRIWMKDAPGEAERPAELRIREVLELEEVDHLVVACPKDLAMFQDAVKTLGAEDRLRVVDLGELVWQATCAANTVEVVS
jgi:Fe-S oxidoreductase/nitrate reductase gamma subunit